MQTFTQSLDLTNCDKEPIHVSGAIQPHGVLFCLHEPSFVITDVSANVKEFFGVAPEQILGQRLHQWIDPQSGDGIFERFAETDLGKHNPHRILFKNSDREFVGIAHRFKKRLILEVEPSTERVGNQFTSFYHQARESVQRLRAASDLKGLYDAAVSEIRRITGFDRVLIYKFDDSWNGHVLAEETTGNVDSFLDLHFPASDIPRQVRELYLLNRLRIIPTTNYEASAIVPNNGPVDLSLSVLRSVSPIHREYLKNMRATASMSISILKSNKLWGLISCTHESGPLYVPYDARAVCDFLAENLSSLLPVHEIEEDSAYRIGLATIQGALLHGMTQADDFIDGLLQNPEAFLKIANATGGAIYYGGEFHVVGSAPADAHLRAIVDWLDQHQRDTIFSTISLPNVLPQAEEYKDTACGLMAFSISKAQESYFLWFRPEEVQTVKWGGNPNKRVEAHGQLHPRKSFEAWKETVRLQSSEWREEEKQAVANLRSSIIDIVLERVEKLTRLNVELERSNTELDSFAYAASHDLKEPLRGIHNYVALVLREDGEHLSADNRRRMESVTRLTQRSEDLINSLLHYSQIGRTTLLIRRTSLDEVLHNALEALRSRIEEERVQIEIEDQLPTVVCDRVQITEVFTNLITNAIKYNSSENKVVKIGVRHSPETGHSPLLYVADNGIGIDPRHFVAIFKIFKRLHGKDKFGGGTGTGLTITKKIIERHGGNIWIESEPGRGTTFLFTLGEGEQNVE